MDSQDIPQRPSEESVTFTIRTSTRNVFVAKLFILLVLVFSTSYFYARDNSRKYDRGRELTQEEYLEGYEEYKASLLQSKQYENPFLSTLVMFITFSVLIGSYELTALIIGFAIGKVIKK